MPWLTVCTVHCNLIIFYHLKCYILSDVWVIAELCIHYIFREDIEISVNNDLHIKNTVLEVQYIYIHLYTYVYIYLFVNTT